MTDSAQENTSFEPQSNHAGLDCAPEGDDLAVENTPAEPAGAYVPCSPTEDVQWYRSSGRPRELAWLAETFANSFAAAAGGLLRADLTVRLAAVSETTRRQFTRAIEEPTCTMGLVPDSADDEQAAATCLEFSPALAMDLVERLMGGRGPSASPGQAGSGRGSDSPAPHRPLTPAERRVLLHLANLVAICLSAARPGENPCKLRADLATPTGDPEDRVVLATFELSLSGRVGTMRLCGCGRLADCSQAERHRRTVAAPLEVTASIEGTQLDDDDLASLAADDVIVTDLPTDGEVIVRVGGIPKFAARLKVTDGRKTLEITRRLGPPTR